MRIWFDRPGVRWPRALLLAALGTAVVAWWLGSGVDDVRDRQPQVQASGDPAAAVAPASAAAARRVDTAALPATASQPANDPAAAPGAEVRVCGLGSVAAGSGGADLAARRLRAERTRPVMQRWLEALQAGPEPRGKAVAQVLAPVLAAPPVAPVRPACADDADCPTLSTAAATSAWVSQRERVAELAEVSRDPGLLAFALQACGTGSKPDEAGACARLAAEDAVAADPAHAEPWLQLAAAELARGEDESATDAMRHALAVPFGRVAEQALFAAVQSAQPADAGVQERLQMGEALQALRAGWREAGGAAASAWCGPSALAVAGRRELCQQLAEHLVLRGATLQDVSSGRAIGKRLGWFPERMAAAARDLDAAARLADSFRGAEAHDCPAAQRQLDYFAAVAAQGEVAAVRRFATLRP
ncbi:hypothetical protein [Variovorax sp. YR752]|uniref:hypothetical protein n=1 Tax=Variovorax sp. YR752 TaxID=1884383 RepID=UPI003137DD92